MESKHKIIILIRKFLDKKCTEKELDELFQLFHKDGSQSQIKSLLYEYWLSNPSFQQKLDRRELAEMLGSIHHQINLEANVQKTSLLKRIGSYAVRAAAVLFIPLLIGTLWMLRQNMAYDTSDTMITLETPLGSKLKTTLPDGTEVWQNGGTTIRYPGKFTRKNRMVYLNGEAYFHVTSDKLNPFLVHTEKGTVKVTGTRFNVISFTEDEETTIVLEEGKIAYRSKKSPDSEYLLTPGEQIIDDKSSNKIQKCIADVEKHISWKEGRLILRNDALEEVVLKLRRWYGADIYLIDESPRLRQLTFTLTIEQETLPQVLEYLSQAAPRSISTEKISSTNEGSLIKTRYKISSK